MKKNQSLEFYFQKPGKWQQEFGLLRGIVLMCGLEEEMKWGHPCYTLGKNNVVLIHGFKDYCALLFFKGALLEDPAGILVQQTKNVQAARQIRFTDHSQILAQKKVLKAYILQAIAIEKSGLKVPLKQTAAFSVPEEFRARLDEDPRLEKAFRALTPGRQRAYLLFFGSAKQAGTRRSRIDKYSPAILTGKGLND